MTGKTGEQNQLPQALYLLKKVRYLREFKQHGVINFVLAAL